MAKEGYQVALASGEDHTWVINEPEPIPKPSEKSQEVKIISRDLTKVLKIGLTLPTLEKEKMISFLKANQDVFLLKGKPRCFRWKHDDMPEIDRKIIQHRLNVNLE